MGTRRRFLKRMGLGAMASIALPNLSNSRPPNSPKFISTWSHGALANQTALNEMKKSGNILSAVEQGVRIIESDADGRSVGLGGLPDRSGKVTLDASIMKGNGACGAVGSVYNIEHPISIARKVMEETPHVMLVGDGARNFALENGFPDKELLTDETRRDYQNWKKEQDFKAPPVNHENHDTIGLLGIDSNGNMAGACTTSGWAYKIPGRLGDSPIIGAGLFVDDEVGAATASGLGETIIQVAGCHLVVELMRQGRSPEEACREAAGRITKKHSKWNESDVQACFIAMGKDGTVGSYSIKKGFQYAVLEGEKENLIDAPYLIR